MLRVVPEPSSCLLTRFSISLIRLRGEDPSVGTLRHFPHLPWYLPGFQRPQAKLPALTAPAEHPGALPALSQHTPPSFQHEQGRLLAATAQRRPPFCQPRRCRAWPRSSLPAPSLLHAACGSLLAAGGDGFLRRIHQRQGLPWPAAGLRLCSSPPLPLEPPLLAPRSEPLSAPPPGWSAIGAGDANPAQVSFLRERRSDLPSSTPAITS